MAEFSETLPKANQSESLRIQILSGSEYRSRFHDTSAYVSDVVQALTDKPADRQEIAAWTEKLNSGLSASQFVKSVASSPAGKVGQIDHVYLDYLLREPTTSELDSWLQDYQGTNVQDRPSR